MVCVAAIIVAEFFICTAMQALFAIKANPGFCYHVVGLMAGYKQ